MSDDGNTDHITDSSSTKQKPEIIALQEEILSLKEELSIHKKKLKILDEVIEEGLFVHYDFTIKEANVGMVRITGYSAEELVGMHIKKILPPATYRKLGGKASGDVGPIELRMIRKDKREVHVRIRSMESSAGQQGARVVLVQNISEQQEVKQMLHESEERHKMVTRLLSDFMYMSKIAPDRNPEIFWVSGSMENVCGYSFKEIQALENGWTSILHPDDEENVTKIIYDEYGLNKHYENEYRIIDNEGKERWLLDKSICVKFDHKTMELILLGAIKDITAQILLEEKIMEGAKKQEDMNLELVDKNTELSHLNQRLKQSELKFKDLIRNLPVGVGIVNEETMLFANNALKAILGVRVSGEVVGAKFEDYVEEGWQNRISRRLSNKADPLTPEKPLNIQIKRKDGSVRIARVIFSDIEFEGNQSKQIVIRDITEEKRSESAIKRAAGIFRNIQIGIIIFQMEDKNDDRSLKLVSINPAAFEIFEDPRQDLVGKYIDEIFPKIRKRKIPQQYAEVVRTKIPVEIDDIFYEDEKLRSTTFLQKVFPLPNNCVAVSFENVSDQTQEIEDLRSKNQELKDFVYKISHDLKAPINSIKGLINLSKIEKEKTDYTDLIIDRLDHLDSFIRDILSHSRNLNVAIVIEEVDILQIINDWLDELKFMDGCDQIDITVDIKNSGQTFYSDKTRLSEIMRNLISNAIKYHDKRKDQMYIRIKGKITAEQAVISIEDNGIGIRDEFKEDIFKMFYRATDMAEGTGVGLYLVKQAVEKLNGILTMKSENRVGTAFTMEIPNMITKKES